MLLVTDSTDSREVCSCVSDGSQYGGKDVKFCGEVSAFLPLVLLIFLVLLYPRCIEKTRCRR